MNSDKALAMNTALRWLFPLRILLLACLLLSAIQMGPVLPLSATSPSGEPRPHAADQTYILYFANYVQTEGVSPPDFFYDSYLPQLNRQEQADLQQRSSEVRAASPNALDQILDTSSRLFVQNLGAVDEKFETFYTPTSGTGEREFVDLIAAGEMKSYPAIGSPLENFDGSLRITANQPFAAVMTQFSNNTPGGLTAYEGSQASNADVIIPAVHLDLFAHVYGMAFQNAAEDPSTINIDFKGESSSCQLFATIKANHKFLFGNEELGECLDNGFTGYAIISSPVDAPFAAVFSEVGGNRAYSYRGTRADQIGTEVVLPFINLDAQNTTGIQVLNMSDNTVGDLTIAFKALLREDSGAGCGLSITLPPLKSTVIDTADFLTNELSCDGGTRWHGMALLTSSTPIVASAQVQGQFDSAAYNGFNPAFATGKIAMPLIVKNNDGFSSIIHIANVGTANTDITCTFSGTSQTATLSNVPPDSVDIMEMWNSLFIPIQDGYLGAARCQSSGQPIVAVVSAGNGYSDFAYEGYNY